MADIPANQVQAGQVPELSVGRDLEYQAATHVAIDGLEEAVAAAVLARARHIASCVRRIGGLSTDEGVVCVAGMAVGSLREFLAPQAGRCCFLDCFVPADGATATASTNNMHEAELSLPSQRT